MPRFNSWLLVFPIIFVLPFLASLHYLLDKDAWCNNGKINHNMHNAPQSLLTATPSSKTLLAASSYYHHQIPGTAVPNPREGTPNVLVTTRTDPPFHMLVYPPDVDKYISRNIIKDGIYEARTTQLFMEYLPILQTSLSASSCNVNFVLDMGSNLGYYSLLAASRGYDVVSFEASPDTAWLQQSSAALNGFTTLAATRHDENTGSLLLINKGVSDGSVSTGRMARHDGSPGMTSFASSETEFNLQPGTNGSALDVAIDLVRAGDVLAELGLDNNDDINQSNSNNNICYKLLKIDVEGYELKAMHGLGNLTTSYPFEIILMEYFPHMLNAAAEGAKNNDPLDVLRYIADQGYEFYIIENRSNSTFSSAGDSLTKVEDLEDEDRVKDIHGSGYHINLMAKRI